MKIKKLFSKSNILILTPLILVMVFDFVFTLVGQSAAYWQDFNLVREGNPVARYLLVQHYGYFTLGSFIYGFLILFLVIKLKRPFNIILAAFLFIVHSSASASWVPRIFEKITETYPINAWWYLRLGYFIIVAIISGFCIDRWLKIKNLR